LEQFNEEMPMSDIVSEATFLDRATSAVAALHADYELSWDRIHAAHAVLTLELMKLHEREREKVLKGIEHNLRHAIKHRQQAAS
jgi:hypothetical protein